MQYGCTNQALQTRKHLGNYSLGLLWKDPQGQAAEAVILKRLWVKGAGGTRSMIQFPAQSTASLCHQSGKVVLQPTTKVFRYLSLPDLGRPANNPANRVFLTLVLAEWLSKHKPSQIPFLPPPQPVQLSLCSHVLVSTRA